MRPHFSVWIPQGYRVIYDQDDVFGLLSSSGDPQASEVTIALAPDRSVIATAQANPLIRVSQPMVESIGGFAGLASDVTYIGSNRFGADLFTLKHHLNSHAMLGAGRIEHLVEVDADGTRLIFMAGATTSNFPAFRPVIVQIEQSIGFLAT